MVAAHEGARALQHAGALRCRAGERTQGTRTGAIKVTLHGVRREKSEKAEGCETWGPVLSSRPLYYASFFVKRRIFFQVLSAYVPFGSNLAPIGRRPAEKLLGSLQIHRSGVRPWQKTRR